MDFDYEEYEKQCKAIRNQNYELLELFEEDLKGLTANTKKRHLQNVEFYLNDYLLYADAIPYDEGAERLDEYLGYFFIRKCMWSTPASIKSTATSIKKFYKCMLEHGKLEKDKYDFLCWDLKDNMEQWQADCEQYNDVEAVNPFMLF